MAKAPVLGTVKTRLAATVGDATALAVYQQLLDLTATAVADWVGPVTVHWAGDTAAAPASPLGQYPARTQRGAGLAERLRHAVTPWPDGGVIVIGSDCPGLTSPALAAIADGLTSAPVCLGPAGDGGYWAIGLANPATVPLVFADALPWSQPTLLAATQARLTSAGLGCALGPTLDDLDTEADWLAAQAAGLID